MTPLFPARRSAERFDSLVQGGRPDDSDRATADLLELVGALRSVPEAQARPEFVADLRDRLLLAAETELTPVPVRGRDDVARLTITPRHTRRERRVAVALSTVAVLGATTSMAVASQGAIPGDALYPVKRALENTQAGFSVGDDAKGETILGNASGRLDEVGELSRKDRPDAKLVTQTLNTFADQASQAGQLLISDYEQNGNVESIQELDQFIDTSVPVLADLEAIIPPGASDALHDAAAGLFAIDAAAHNVCLDATCGEPLTELPSQLAGAVAGAVDDVTGPLAGGALPGTTPGESPSDPASGDDGKGGKPSTLNPPETPIELPTDPPTTASGVPGLGEVLGGGDSTGSTGSGGDGSGGNGGKGGKGKPIDLTPVTETVNEVVTGVLDGVNGVLNGLGGTQP